MREFHEDHFSLASLGVRVLSDVIQAAGSAAIGAAAGVIMLTLFGAPAVLVFAVVVGIGFIAGMGFSVIDTKYHLTDRARERMMVYEENLKDKFSAIERLFDEAAQLGRAAFQLRDDVNRTWKLIEEFQRFTPRLTVDSFR